MVVNENFVIAEFRELLAGQTKQKLISDNSIFILLSGNFRLNKPES